MARVVDHASGSEASVSNRIADILCRAGWRTRADLACDQPVDACGYIAADAVVRLRDAALAEADGWMGAALRDYSTMGSVRRGEAVLRRSAADRVLEVADVNTLVRAYSHLDANAQAHEEWWGGAIGQDNFLEGALDDFLSALGVGISRGHQWRAWVVNTQTSRQAGSHWFTVAVGVVSDIRPAAGLPPEAAARAGAAAGAAAAGRPSKRPGKEPPARARSSVGSTSAEQPRPAGGDPSGRPATEQPPAEAGAPSQCPFPALFPELSPALRSALAFLASAEEGGVAAAAWRACQAWDTAAAEDALQVRSKRRKLCTEHGLTCTRAMQIDAAAALAAARVALADKAIAAHKQPPTPVALAGKAIAASGAASAGEPATEQPGEEASATCSA